MTWGVMAERPPVAIKLVPVRHRSVVPWSRAHTINQNRSSSVGLTTTFGQIQPCTDAERVLDTLGGLLRLLNWIDWDVCSASGGIGTTMLKLGLPVLCETSLSGIR